MRFSGVALVIESLESKLLYSWEEIKLGQFIRFLRLSYQDAMSRDLTYLPDTEGLD